jgi:hypothetical protein
MGKTGDKFKEQEEKQNGREEGERQRRWEQGIE